MGGAFLGRGGRARLSPLATKELILYHRCMSDAQQIADMYFEELRERAEREGIDAALHVAAMTLAFYQNSASTGFHRRQGPLLVTPTTEVNGPEEP
jgi:hypothetical protein